MVGYYRKQGLQLRFESKHADIVIQEKAIAGSEPDCVVLLDVADGTPSLAELPAGDLRGKQVVYVVNKMYEQKVPEHLTADIARESVAWSEDRYRQAVDAMRGALDESAKHAIGVPISALHSDNILEPSTNSPWLAQDSASPRTLLDAIDLAVMA